QALYALASSVAMTAFGKNGVQEIAYVNMQKARYLKQQLEQAGISIPFQNSFFNEFVVDLQQPVEKVNELLAEKQIIGCYDLGKSDSKLEGYMHNNVTEIKTKMEMDEFVSELRDIHEK